MIDVLRQWGPLGGSPSIVIDKLALAVGTRLSIMPMFVIETTGCDGVGAEELPLEQRLTLVGDTTSRTVDTSFEAGDWVETESVPGEPGSRTLVLLERERELAALDALVAGTAAGRGYVVLVEGPAGIGKSRLLGEVCHRAESHGLRILSGSGGELERDFAFGVVRQLLEPAVTGSVAGQREGLWSGAARFAEPLFAGLDVGVGAADNRSQAILHGLFWLTANLSEHAPLLVAIDDLHWADQPSLRFVSYLARRVERLPVLVVLAARPAEPGVSARLAAELISSVGAATTIRPQPLSCPAVSVIIRAELGPVADDRLCAACHEATGGNPFLLSALVEELHDLGQRGEIRPEVVRRLGSARIAVAVLLRVGRLGAPAPAVARAIAVLGERAELVYVAALAGVDVAVAGGMVDALVAAAVLERGRPVRFVNPIVRTAIYEDLAACERAQLHARAARLLSENGADIDTVAMHLMAAEGCEDPWTVHTLRAAAAAAIGRGAPETAVGFLRRALREPSAKSLRPVLSLELGVAAARAGDPDAAQLLRTAVTVATDPVTHASAAVELAPVLLAAGQIDEAVEVLERGLAAVENADTEFACQVEAYLLLLGVTGAAAYRRLRDRLDRTLERLATLPERYARMLLAPVIVHLAYRGGVAAELAACADQALAGGQLVRELSATSMLAYPPMLMLSYADRAEEAEQWLDDAFAHSSTRASAVGLAMSSGCRASVRFRRGNLSGAQADAEICLELAVEAGLARFVRMAVAVLVVVFVEQGRLDDAAAALDRLMAVAIDDPDGPPGGSLLRDSRGWLRLARGDAHGALANFDAIRRWEQDIGSVHAVVQVSWRIGAVLAQLRLGERAGALRLAEEQMILAQHFGAPSAVGVAQRALGLAQGGPEGIASLTRAVLNLEGSPARLEHARALIDLGAALRRAGQRSQALKPLRQGMDLAHRCGATALAATAHHQLVAAGARPRRLAVSGREALTPNQQRVAELAAAGMSNLDIAHTLFVTVRTVEMHLSHAYAKLNITSRHQLLAALTRTTQTASAKSTQTPI
jgi:DNA-binding CsgD family transcriptional regulator